MGQDFENIYELTPLQQGMLFHTLYAPESYVYNIQLDFGLRGRLDEDIFESAWRELVARHQVLRTFFVWEQLENPFQVVQFSADAEVARIDLRSLSPEQREQELERIVREDKTRPIALNIPPLMRITLVRLDESQYRFLWTLHHIILEGWSAAILLAELGTIYSAKLEGREPNLSAPLPYSNYISWLQQQSRSDAEAYRRDALRGFDHSTHLPIDLASGNAPARVMSSEHAELRIATETTEAIRELARKHRLTVNTLIQGVWSLLISRYTGESDIVFGVVVSGRPPMLAGSESMVGLFVNTLPARVQVRDEESVLSWLQELQTRQVELRQFEYCSLVDVKQWSDLPQGQPLFDHVLAFENWFSNHSAGNWLKYIEISRVNCEEGSDYPLAFVVVPSQQLQLKFVYDAERYTRASIHRMLGHLKTLLESIVANPEQRLGDLELITEDERRQILIEWNNTHTEYPRDATVQQLFEEQAAQRPDAVALVYGNTELTYGDLNARANQLAHYLRSLGVGPETLVGLSVERGIEMVVGILGILKAGGAYVPIDVEYPRERIALMFEDASPPVLITQSIFVELLPPYQGHIVCLDTEWDQIATWSIQDFESGADADNLIYVMYTSGSTGRPKGACITHRNVVRLVRNANYYNFGPDDNYLLFAPISFDASTLELWGSLLNGSKIVIYPAGEISLDHLARMLGEQHITILWLTSALFYQMVDLHLDALRSVRHVLTGGDVMSVPHAKRMIATLEGERRVTNCYGPTENTTFSTCHLLDARSNIEKTVPIGRPISNSLVYILDAHFRPVPIGIPGELYVGGDGVGRGYLNRPELTAERFIPNPYGKNAEDRLYKTGDLVRWNEDGTIDFICRIDKQIKLRGFRIEPCEIEQALLENEAVRQALVIAREDDPGDKRLVAYLVPSNGAAISIDGLRKTLKQKLPDYMMPSAFVELPSLPIDPNGKLDRRALPAPDHQRHVEETFVAPRNDIERIIAGIWREVLRLDQVGINDNFFDLGGHSLLLIKLQSLLNEQLSCNLSMVELFEYPTIATLAKRVGGDTAADDKLAEQAQARIANRARTAGDYDAIAIIAMAGRFPGADGIEQLWENLREGIESIRTFSDEELRGWGVPSALITDPRYVKRRAVVDGVEMFDANFFDYTPREAEIIDPQQRLFLECAWEALERAGYDPERYSGSIGVFAGAAINTYLDNIKSQPEIIAMMGPLQALVGSDKDFLPTRVSYKLNLRGPSINVQTACSTSLVAVHLACQSLQNFDSDMALAGGVSLSNPQSGGYLYQESGILSPDGHCRTFDAKARGTVGGDGAAIVVLKRLHDALADGDTIHAVIRGTAINNDGSLKIGYTAPSVEGQAEVIALAQAAAQVEPDTIGYIEAHGTATELGDPIEITALTKAFRAKTSRTGYCAIGSLKSNMGHLNAAAGVAGLIKAALVLEKGEIPPSLHYETSNPQIDFDHSPFVVADTLRRWERPNGVPRRAGVSSFGLGGTNAHAVLEEAPAVEPGDPAHSRQLLLLSARTPTALDAASARLSLYLRQNSTADLADAAWTLQVGRKQFKHRRAVVCDRVGSAAAALDVCDPKWVMTGEAAEGRRSVVFMFPGQGAQHVGMAAELYAEEPVFRETIDSCAEILAADLGFDLREILYPAQGKAEEAAERLKPTTVTQAALFAVELGMARLWMSWGIQPAALIGHSIGEIVAAHLAGVLELKDALKLIVVRGGLMEKAPAGAMLAIPLPEERVLPLLGDGLWLSAVNGPSLCVVAGTPERIAQLEQQLQDTDAPGRRLHTSGAFHSGLMQGVMQPLTAFVQGLAIQTHPAIRYISNLTGEWITSSDLSDPEYWSRHLRQTVRFNAGIDKLLAEGMDVFLEVGPGNTLGSLLRQRVGGVQQIGAIVIASLPHPRENAGGGEQTLRALGQLWLAGLDPDWQRVHGGRRRRIPLPTYPFERHRYWIERRPMGSVQGTGEAGDHERYADLSDWFFLPSWKRTLLPAPLSSIPSDHLGQCLVFAGSDAFSRAFCDRLAAYGSHFVCVEPGQGFACKSDAEYIINPSSRGDYVMLIQALAESQRMPERIIHLWLAEPAVPNGALEIDADQAWCQRGFYSLLFLAQALGEKSVKTAIKLDVISSEVHDVAGDERISPAKNTILGPVRIIPMEYPNVACRHIDLDAAEANGGDSTARRVLAEILGDDGEHIVALRAHRRWTQSFEHTRISRQGEVVPAGLRSAGVYLITGGLGGIGLELARYLASAVNARLILMSRRGLPERAQWDLYLEQHEASDPTSIAMRTVRSLEQAGAEIMIAAADVANEAEVRAVVSEAERRFGAVHGVVHAAGVPGAGLIQLKTPEVAEAVFAPKIRGTQVLARIFSERQPDFIVLCSSLASVFGGVGQVDYCAANAFQDAFARHITAQYGLPVQSLNWTTWREVGMAVNQPIPPEMRARQAELLAERGISNTEGCEVFARALSNLHEPQILVCAQHLPAVIRRMKRIDTPAAEQPAVVVTANAYPRPNLPYPYVAPRNDVEQRLAEIWTSLLGVGQIGINDGFLDLGGHSLLAIQLVSRIRATFHVEIPLTKIFESASIAGLAEHIQGSQAAASCVATGQAGEREEIEI